MDNPESVAAGPSEAKATDRPQGEVPQNGDGSLAERPTVVGKRSLRKPSRAKAGSPSGTRGIVTRLDSWGVTIPEPPANVSIERYYSGVSMNEIARQLGVSEAAVSALQIKALGKLRRGVLLKKFSFRRDDLRGRHASVFVIALSHALAERAFADRHGITVAETQQFARAIGLDPQDPETWLPTTSPQSQSTTPPSP